MMAEMPPQWHSRNEAGKVLQRLVDEVNAMALDLVNRLAEQVQRNGVDDEGMVLVDADDLETLLIFVRRSHGKRGGS